MKEPGRMAGSSARPAQKHQTRLSASGLQHCPTDRSISTLFFLSSSDGLASNDDRDEKPSNDPLV